MRFVKKRIGVILGVVVLGTVILGGCGVGPQAGQLARQEAGLLATVPSDDAGVREALLGQAGGFACRDAGAEAAWRRFCGVVGEDFRAVVLEVAQLARRQKELIEAGQDDPATNRAVLERMAKMWNDVSVYLGR